MNNLIYAIILTILPISELRGGIPLAISQGYPTLSIFLLLTLLNMLIIFPIFLFLDYLHEHFLKIKFYSFLFNKYVSKTRRKIEKHVGTKWELVALYFLTAIPAPGTGAYTASLAAWLFKIKRRKAYLAISLGVITAGIIVTLISLGIF